MAYTYLFFRPLRLPLQAHELSETTVLALEDAAAVRAALDSALPAIAWKDERGRADIDGQWVEFYLPGGQRQTLALRCSLRADYRAIVQRLCDRLGWLAFDEQAMCYQPHGTPMRA